MYEDRFPEAVAIKPTKDRLSRWRVEAGHIGLGGFPNRERVEGFAEGWNLAREVALDAMQEVDVKTVGDRFFGLMAGDPWLIIGEEFDYPVSDPEAHAIVAAGMTMNASSMSILVVMHERPAPTGVDWTSGVTQHEDGQVTIIDQTREIADDRTYEPFTWEPLPIEPGDLLKLDNPVMFELGMRQAVNRFLEETWGYLQFREWLLATAVTEKSMAGKSGPCVDC